MFIYKQANTEKVRSIILGAEEVTQEQAPNDTNKRGDLAFPAPLEKDAYHGIVGELVKALEPHTEADPAALLLMTLTACGAVIGRGPNYLADGARHGTNLFCCIVGDSSKARKGTAWARVKNIITQAAEIGFHTRIETGLSTGEGLINLVRDGDGGDDAGVADKRLLVVQSEFCSPLKVMRRDGNTLSAILREAWDGDRLRIATKNSPQSATDPHIAIIGHITREELARHISETDAANGFGNRFLWVAAKRSKCLPFGGNLDDNIVADLVKKLQETFAKGGHYSRYQFDEETSKAWVKIYPELSEGKPGLLGAMINRGEAQVIRLALLYAALDGNDVIEMKHLHAALAVWDYCERSARWIFGERLGDSLADNIFDALMARPARMTRTEISSHLGRNAKAERIETALQFLYGHGKVRNEQKPAADGIGRPVERWYAITKETNFTKPPPC